MWVEPFQGVDLIKNKTNWLPSSLSPSFSLSLRPSLFSLLSLCLLTMAVLVSLHIHNTIISLLLVTAPQSCKPKSGLLSLVTLGILSQQWESNLIPNPDLTTITSVSWQSNGETANRDTLASGVHTRRKTGRVDVSLGVQKVSFFLSLEKDGDSHLLFSTALKLVGNFQKIAVQASSEHLILCWHILHP